MVYTVTLNPSVDCLMTVDHLAAGTLHRASTQVLRPGGKGVNVALTLARLGAETCALGFIAGQTGELLESLLSSERVPHHFIRLPQGQTRINVKVAAQEETEINGAGPAVGAQALASLIHALTVLTPEDILILSGSVPPGLPEDIYARLTLAARGARVIVDASGSALRRALSARPYLVKPNLTELSEYLGSIPATPAQVAAGAERLVDAGAQHVLVSMGQAGALLLRGTDALLLDAPAGTARGTVGAGDAMVAGFAQAMTRGAAAESALACAVAAGSAAAFSPWLPTKEQVSAVRARIDSPRVICYNG